MPGEVRDVQKRKWINKTKDKDTPAAKSLSRTGTSADAPLALLLILYERRSKLLKPSCFFYKQKNSSKKFLMPSFLFASVNEKQFSTAEHSQTQQRCYVWQKCWTTVLKLSFTSLHFTSQLHLYGTHLTTFPEAWLRNKCNPSKLFGDALFLSQCPLMAGCTEKLPKGCPGKWESWSDWCEILCRCTQLGKHWVHQGCHFCSLFPWCPLDLSYLGDLLCHTQWHTLVHHDIWAFEPICYLGQSSAPIPPPQTFTDCRGLLRDCGAGGDFLREMPGLKQMIKANPSGHNWPSVRTTLPGSQHFNQLPQTNYCMIILSHLWKCRC